MLVTRGTYSLVRHPLYAATLLGCLSQVLLLPNWLTGPVPLVVFAALCVRRLPMEEDMMRSHFREEYIDYCAKTKQLIPHVY